MDELTGFDELMDCRSSESKKAVEPCTIVIFGASGDLTVRKLIPALYHLHLEGALPDPFRIVGFARREKTHKSWREELKKGMKKFSRTGLDKERWAEFEEKVFYCRGDLSDAGAYDTLGKQLQGFGDEKLRNNLLFYLAISPSLFGTVVKQLHHAKLLDREEREGQWQRVVVEKPFGTDLPSAEQLNHELITYAHEKQIYRIDHYLGKETVQNILMFRFSNAIFERLWNRESIDHIQITVSESLGVGSRGGYYEESGAMRDMVQNHLLQILSLIAMEPPVSLEAEAIRDEKVKLLKSIRPIEPEDIPNQVVRGQYFAGQVNNEQRPGYRQEERVEPNSNTETFLAMKLFIDTWRWSGVPFFLRTGKNMPLSASEVRVQFKQTPHVLFATQRDGGNDPNAITLRLQPHQGIYLRFNGKVPGTSTQIRPVRMNFSYDSEFGAYTPEAYERLLLEAIAGDATLFIRRDEVETAWRIVDPIRAGWKGQSLTNREFYSAGTWGPVAAEELLSDSGHHWRNPQPAR
ncbi:MAG: glucose-6-phosphate dehydrogenase [Verrucomicrobiales bacterium]|nr:glucose-6-phosphate dehydrogenase [Verrucomicrobiales bacterium]